MVTLSAFELPERLTLTDHGDGTASLEGTPSQADADTGSFTIELQAESGAGLTGDLIFELSVTAVNDPPIAQTQSTITLLEDADPRVIIASELFADEEETADQLIISVVAFDEALLDAAWDLEKNELTLTPKPDASGEATVTVQSTDSGGLQAEASLSVTGTAVPDPPVAAQHPGLEIPEDGENATLTLSDWFSDIDSASLAYEWELPDSAAMLVIGQLNGEELVCRPRCPWTDTALDPSIG
ncbi:MAG: hypothetical protein ACI957_004932 [Verrucomicrobiales bacterium]